MEHQLYYPLNFQQTELDVYSSNNILPMIKSYVLNYTEDDLKQNSFQLFYKPFSPWKSVCQNQLTTVQMMGYSDTMYATQEFYPQIFMLTVSTFVVIFVYQIFGVMFWKSNRVWNILVHSLGFISEFSLLIATIVYYGRSLSAYG